MMTAQPTNGHKAPFQMSAASHRHLEGPRRSTPDSEVVLSDDDPDVPTRMSLSLHSVKTAPVNKPVRRASWLAEVQSSQRKQSLGASSLTSNSSQPPTPGCDIQAQSNGHPFQWSSSSQIWGQPRSSRLSEVLPSPTTTVDDVMSPLSAMPNKLPFEFPLEPNRKTVRSQSYSAGQLEKRAGAPRMPSRIGLDGSTDLDSLNEEESQNSESFGRDGGVSLVGYDPFASPPQARRQSFLAETTQALPAPSEDTQDSAVDDESASLGSNVARLEGPLRPAAGESRGRWQTSLGFGIIEEDPQSRRHSFADVAPRNRLSSPATQQPQQGTGSSSSKSTLRADSAPFIPSAMREQSQFISFTFTPDQAAAISEQLQLGFLARQLLQAQNSTLYEPLQATRNDNFSLFSQQVPTQLVQLSPYDSEDRLSLPERQELHRRTYEPTDEEKLMDQGFAASYFAGVETKSRNTLEEMYEKRNNKPFHKPFEKEPDPFSVPTLFARPQRILYLVTFKCNRSDIYYVSEGNGLEITEGNLVVVEGDRGLDLGSVQHAKISVDEAKRLKEEYSKKHVESLLMFSKSIPRTGETYGLEASGSVPDSSRLGPADTEPRPKCIKRIARPDEIHLLREKEGQEAKAKRVCQAKVHEHGLRMEILDAEFQSDYKKLTFYYYADEYINFNDLVTDLFKVYKTRIWMSAINPASFPLIAAPQRLPLGSPATPTAMIGSGRGGAVVPYRHQMHPGRDRPWSRLQTQGRGASVANVHANLQPQMPGVQHHNIQSLQGMQAPTPQNQSLQFGAMGTMAGMGGVPSQVASAFPHHGLGHTRQQAQTPSMFNPATAFRPAQSFEQRSTQNFEQRPQVTANQGSTYVNPFECGYTNSRASGSRLPATQSSQDPSVASMEQLNRALGRFQLDGQN